MITRSKSRALAEETKNKILCVAYQSPEFIIEATSELKLRYPLENSTKSIFIELRNMDNRLSLANNIAFIFEEYKKSIIKRLNKNISSIQECENEISAYITKKICKWNPEIKDDLIKIMTYAVICDVWIE
tara:strand:+ start:843 stop:1232 length:390 start_codon:yes stop_codon:yes gene_type:complete